MQNREALLKAGWDYPDFHLLHMAHHKLAYSISSNAQHTLPGDWQAEFRDLIADPDKKFIFSSELFFRTVEPQDVARFFPPDETKIVLYLRDHLSYMMSWYAQAVQERVLTASFADYVQLFSQSFSGYLQKWENVYGAENVITRAFERDSLEGADSRVDFLSTVEGVSTDDIQLSEERSNLSISGNLLFFKKVLNLYMTDSEATTPPITDEIGAFASLSDTFNGKFFVPAEDVGLVRRIFRQDMDVLNTRGLVFKAMPEEIDGNRCPDFRTLRQDIKFIKDVAVRTDKMFLKYAARWQDWHVM